MPKGVCTDPSKGKSMASRRLALESSLPPKQAEKPKEPPTQLPVGKLQSPPQSWAKGDIYSKVEKELQERKGRKHLPEDLKRKLVYAAIFHDDSSPKKNEEGDLTLKCGIEGATEMLGRAIEDEGARYGLEEETLAWDVRHSAKKKRGGVHEARVRKLESGGSAEPSTGSGGKESVARGRGEKEKSVARERGKKEKSVGRGRGKKEKSVARGRGKKEKSVGRGRGKKEKSVGEMRETEIGHEASHDVEESGGVGGTEVSEELGGNEESVEQGTEIATAMFQTPTRKSYVETETDSEKYVESSGGSDSDWQMSDVDEQLDFVGFEDVEEIHYSSEERLSEEEEEEEERERVGRREARARSARHRRSVGGGRKGKLKDKGEE